MTNWIDVEPDTSAVEIAAALSGWAKVAAGRLPDRLALAMMHAVRSGLFPDGMRLPPERELAKVLAVSRPTVSAALDILRNRQLVASRHGSGTWIRAPVPAPASREPIVDIVRGKGGINLAASVPPDASHLDGLDLAAAELLRVEPLNGYNAHGLDELRELAARHHRDLGLATQTDEIVVTEGAHDGLASAIERLAGPGQLIAVEEYSHPGMADIATATGIRLVGIRLDEDGVDIDHLASVVRAGTPAALVLQPLVNSPTGRSCSARRLDELAALVDRLDLTVIENNAVSDLAFDGRKAGLAGRCERATVVSVETLSKTAWGGLRIGWIRARTDAIADIGISARRTALGVSIPSQLMAIRVLQGYPDLISSRCRRLQSHARRMMTLLSSHLPDWRPTAPAGGLSLWLRLPLSDTRAFAELAAKHGVSVLPGALTTMTGTEDQHVRVCFDRSERELAVGVERLSAAWAEVCERIP